MELPFLILFYSAASFTGQGNGFLSPPAPMSDVGHQTTQPDDVNGDSSDDRELRPAYIEQQQWGFRRQRCGRRGAVRLSAAVEPNGSSPSVTTQGSSSGALRRHRPLRSSPPFVAIQR
nr:hypothetical protein Iba_chr11aCG10330 [Ipomoea batatas]